MKPKPQLLIVDNNVSMLRLLSNVLAEDYDIVAKLNPIEAYTWLQDGHYPALTIIDVQAANMAEFSLVKNLKISGMYRDMPVVMMSPAERDTVVLPAASGGINAYVQKPFNPGQLKETINRLITAPYSHAA